MKMEASIRIVALPRFETLSRREQLLVLLGHVGLAWCRQGFQVLELEYEFETGFGVYGRIISCFYKRTIRGYGYDLSPTGSY